MNVPSQPACALDLLAIDVDCALTAIGDSDINNKEKATIPDIQDGFVGLEIVLVLSINNAGALNAGVWDSCFMVGFKKEVEAVEKS